MALGKYALDFPNLGIHYTGLWVLGHIELLDAELKRLSRVAIQACSGSDSTAADVFPMELWAQQAFALGFDLIVLDGGFDRDVLRQYASAAGVTHWNCQVITRCCQSNGWSMMYKPSSLLLHMNLGMLPALDTVLSDPHPWRYGVASDCILFLVR